MNLKRWKTLCAAGIFLVLTAIKLLLPDLSAALRLRTLTALRYNGDYIAVLETLGEKLSLAGDAYAAAEETPETLLVPVQAAPRANTFYRVYAVEEAVSSGEWEPEMPAAVAAFLESQAAFADYALPENVAYDYLALPFDFAVPVSGYNSSGFGYRLHPILNDVRFHYGTDFAANSGDAVLAFADGDVTFAGYDESFGWHIRIDHGSGWESHYAHCSQIYVNHGQRVSKGDTIALVGSTGLATGPHLHFELTKDGTYRNPEYYVNA